MESNNNKNGNFSQEKILRSRSWIFFFILFVLVFGFAIYYFSEIEKEIKFLESINPFWLIIAVAAQFLTYLFTAITYRLFLGISNLQSLPGLWSLIKASMISLFFNQAMPSAGISGNTFFFSYLLKLKVKFSQILSVILAEFLTLYIAMDILALVLLIANYFFYTTAHAINITLLIGVTVYFIFFILIVFAGRKKSLEFLLRKIQNFKLTRKLFKAWIEKLQEHNLDTNIRLISLLRVNKMVVGAAIVGQFLLILADALTLYALFYGLGIPVAFFIVLLVLMSTKIVSLLPFLPGSLVLYESSMSLFFSTMGVPLGTAIIATMVYRLLSFWLPMPVGLFLYRKWLKEGRLQTEPPV